MKYLFCLFIVGLVGCGGSGSDKGNSSTPETVNAPPSALFGIVNNDFDVVFSNQSTDANNDTLTYSWSFGDGETSTLEAPSHTYENGTFQITLTVSDGKTTTSAQQEVVINVPIISAETKLEAESYSSANGDVLVDDTGTLITHLNSDGYMVYENINLSGTKSVSIVYATENTNAHIEFRLNAVDGPLFAVAKLNNTNDLQIFNTKTTAVLNPVEGINTLYVIGRAQQTVATIDYYLLQADEIPAGNNTLVLDESSSGLCGFNGSVDSDNNGYTGAGFLNSENTEGATVQWAINAENDGVYSVGLTYANGGATPRSSILSINGVGAQRGNQDTTGAWDTWTDESFTVTLEQGDNLIAFSAQTTDGLANIDKVVLVGDNLVNATCPTDEIAGQHSGPLLSQDGNPVHSRYNKYKSEWSASKADIILSYQYDNGGWPKNQDYVSMGNGGSGIGSTIDNGATTLEMTFLADRYVKTGEDKYLQAVRKAMSYILEAQYPSGGWPQFYPLKGGYADHVTFNDDAMSRVLTLLYHAVNELAPFDTDIFTNEDRLLFQQAINKGTDYILKSQWKQNGQLTVWCAQHGATDYLPKAARAYELASLSGSESVEIIGFLMTQPQSPEIKAAVQGALAWFNSPNTYLADYVYNKSVEEKIVFSAGNRMWYRFYDLDSNVGFFSDRDGGVYDNIMDISAERRNGYSWGGNYGEKIINYAQQNQ